MIDRFRIGINRWGWDSDFRKGYQSLCAQLHFERLDKYFDEWDEKYLNTPLMLRERKIEKIKNKINK